MVWPTWTAVADEEARFGRGQLCTLLPTHHDRQEQRAPTRSGQILGKARGTGCRGPTSMDLAWRPAGAGACHPTSLFGRLGLQSSALCLYSSTGRLASRPAHTDPICSLYWSRREDSCVTIHVRLIGRRGWLFMTSCDDPLARGRMGRKHSCALLYCSRHQSPRHSRPTAAAIPGQPIPASDALLRSHPAGPTQHPSERQSWAVRADPSR